MNKYIKTTRNSYGQFLRSRERMIHVSCSVQAPSVNHPNGIVYRPGNTYTKK